MSLKNKEVTRASARSPISNISVLPDAATERLVLSFVLLLATTEIIGGFASPPVLTFGIILFAAISLFVVPIIARRYQRLPMRILYVVYILPLLFLLYPIAQKIAIGLHDRIFDSTLIAIDQFMFGGINPTQWIFAHIHLSELIVELLEYTYFAHYLYPIILITELFVRQDYVRLRDYRFAMIYGVILSFILNMAIPAIGPRFTLHEFSALGKELPGVWILDTLRDQLNTGEGITAVMTSKEAALSVLRDAFPSGHTMLTVMTLIFAFRYKATVRWFLLPLGLSLIISTVLLRYHYVIDVIAGIAFAIFAVKTAPALWRFFGRRKDENGGNGENVKCKM